MSQAVVIKSNKYGFNLILDPNMPFPELLEAIIQKFEESAKFFKDAKLAISFDGRLLSQDEELCIIEEITKHTQIRIICIVDENMQHIDRTKAKVDGYYNGLIGKEGDLYQGSLKDGQTLESEAGITIVGDVAAGATIKAGGNIIVLGSLYGTAIAGAGGNVHSFIAAIDMDPTNLQIGTVKASYGGGKGKKKKGGLLKKDKGPVLVEAQMATVRNDGIFIYPVPKDILVGDIWAK